MGTELSVFLTFGGALILIFLLGKAPLVPLKVLLRLFGEQYSRRRTDYNHQLYRSALRNYDTDKCCKCCDCRSFRNTRCGYVAPFCVTDFKYKKDIISALQISLYEAKNYVFCF